jgi:dTDP-4-amino-4,6-dideoxygalactose transaminase
LHVEPYFAADTGGVSLPETERAALETMFLPIFPGLTEEEQHQVVDALAQSLEP